MGSSAGSNGRLTTHVLDTALGRPASSLPLCLFQIDPGDGSRRVIVETETNADGRCDQPLLAGDLMNSGTYELVFQAGAYFDRMSLSLPEPKFLDDVVIRFGISDTDQHYHVPLLISPFGYSTYRGS